MRLGYCRRRHRGRAAGETPSRRVDLGNNYSRVDVSLQAFNGSTVHARTSVLRGSLAAS